MQALVKVMVGVVLVVQGAVGLATRKISTIIRSTTGSSSTGSSMGADGRDTTIMEQARDMGTMTSITGSNRATSTTSMPAMEGEGQMWHSRCEMSHAMSCECERAVLTRHAGSEKQL